MESRRILPLFLFPSISWWKESQSLFFIDAHEKWAKQTFRNRFDIAGPNGRQSLSIPTKKKTRTYLKDVEIDYDSRWEVLHWRSIETAYNRSPFFEYYKDELRSILTKQNRFLVDLSLSALEWCYQKLSLDKQFQLSTEYLGFEDVVEIKKMEFEPYHQVFETKNGFIEDLSVLDLLFNTGPEAGQILP